MMDRYSNRTDNQSIESAELSSPPLICSTIMITCCVIGLPGNLISTSIFFRLSWRSPINILLFSLSIFDFALLLLSAPVMLFPSLNVHFKIDWIERSYPYSLVICYPLSMIIESCSMWTFVLISLERYLAVCKPFQSRKWCTTSRTKWAQILVIALSILANLIRFWEYQLDGSALEGYSRLLRHSYLYFALYHVVLHLITHFIIPLSLISYLGAKILHTMSKIGRPAAKCNSASMNRRLVSQRKTTRMITLATSMFIFCNSLPFFLNLWEAVDFDLFEGPNQVIAYPLLDLANTLVFLNASTTFVFYWAYCQKYRLYLVGDIVRVFRFCCAANLHPSNTPSIVISSTTGWNNCMTQRSMVPGSPTRSVTMTSSRANSFRQKRADERRRSSSLHCNFLRVDGNVIMSTTELTPDHEYGRVTFENTTALLDPAAD